LPSEPRYWLRNRSDGIRYAGVNSYGVDGSCTHVILGNEEELPERFRSKKIMPLGGSSESLFIIPGESPAEIATGLSALLSLAEEFAGADLAQLARRWHQKSLTGDSPLALSLVARNREELSALVQLGRDTLNEGDGPVLPHPALRDRLFYSPAPLGKDARIGFIFPGSGNHFAGMGMALSTRWPEIFRKQDYHNLYLRSQFQPEMFWNGAPAGTIDNDHRAVIFGQVATGCAVSDIVRSFKVSPSAVIGYSLGESAGLFALGAWRERDTMLLRMYDSTLFTEDLAGECRAVARAWGIPEGKKIDWQIGVVSAPAREVRRAIRMTTRVYLLIVNTPNECVIGGDAKGVKRIVAILGCSFFQLSGVTTVHCEVAREVAQPYRDLHLFNTNPPDGVTFYSGAEGGAYEVNRESAADAILAQALEGINYPAVINSAYADGVRIFLEMGPGASCSRMIDQILEGRPHLARSACAPGLDGEGAILRLLANLAAERVPLDLSRLYAEPPQAVSPAKTGTVITVSFGGKPFAPPLLPEGRIPASPVVSTFQEAGSSALKPLDELSDAGRPVAEPLRRTEGEPLLREFAAAQEAKLQAHETYLRFSEGITNTMAQAMAMQLVLQQALGDDIPPETGATRAGLEPAPTLRPCVFDRDLCFEFARGSVARMLGEAFAEADGFPTRVRLPDEPLMLVDRIVALEGEPKSMTSGRVVTEHDVLPGAWYLDGGRIPTCVAVE